MNPSQGENNISKAAQRDDSETKGQTRYLSRFNPTYRTEVLERSVNIDLCIEWNLCAAITDVVYHFSVHTKIYFACLQLQVSLSS